MALTYIRLLYFITCLAFLAGCRQTSHIIDSSRKRADNIENIAFEYIQGKAKLKFSDAEKELDVRTNIRIRKDSVIWMNFSVVGLQGGRALINKDSITILDNMKKKYLMFSFAELSERYRVKITYDALQSLLLGNLLVPNDANTKEEVTAGQRILTSHIESVLVKNYVSLKSRKIEQIEIEDSQSGMRSIVEYSNFQLLVNKLFPYLCRFSMHYMGSDGMWKDMYITLDYVKVEVGNTTLKFPFNIPKRYDRE